MCPQCIQVQLLAPLFEVTKQIHESTRSLIRGRRLQTKTAQTLKPRNKPNGTCSGCG